ncbi:MAG: sulfatase [bacterium]
MSSRHRAGGRGRAPSGSRQVFALCILISLALCIVSCGNGRDGARPNVVLIVIDALRADHLGCYGYGRPTSPTIDSLAENGVLFETAITQAPWTKSSFSSFLTSRYPFQHGVEDWAAVMPESIVTLPEVLSGHAYSTVCVINMLGMGGRFGVLRGFEEVSESGKAYRDAETATEDAIEYLRNTKAPFFMMLHYFDVHQPYAPTPEYVDLINVDTDLDPFAGRGMWRRGRDGLPPPNAVVKSKLLYDGCIRYVDDSLARLMSFIDDLGIRENTVIIVTADHGEAFWEHGVDTHGSTVYDEVLRVPLIVVWPGRFKTPRRVATQVRLVDLMPTVLEMTGASDDRHMEGVSLLPLIEGGQIDNEGGLLPFNVAYAGNGQVKPPEVRCLRTLDYKVIADTPVSRIEAYDLKADPCEIDDLPPDRPPDVAVLASLLSSLPGAHGETGARKTALTDEEKSSLRALGYIQ